MMIQIRGFSKGGREEKVTHIPPKIRRAKHRLTTPPRVYDSVGSTHTQTCEEENEMVCPTSRGSARAEVGKKAVCAF